MLPTSTIYLGMVVALGLGAVVFAAVASRLSGTARRLGLVAAVPAAAMAVAYLGMGLEWLTIETEGREQSIMRFLGYTVALTAYTYLLARPVGLSRRRAVGLLAVLLVTLWSALATWLTTGAAETAITLLSVLAYLVGVYLLFKPFSRVAAAAPGEARLLYGKLRNLFVLCWGGLLVASAISEQAIGLTDAFIGQFAASYIDLVLMLGIGGLVLFSRFVRAPTAAERADATAAD